MDRRKIFTLDHKRFPLDRMRQLVDYLHDHDQKYIVMVDPALGVSGKLSAVDNSCLIQY